MAKYRVSLQTGADFTYEVEADNEDEAFEAAFEEVPAEVCAHCSGWGKGWSLDLGTWDVAQEDGHDASWAIEEVDA